MGVHDKSRLVSRIGFAVLGMRVFFRDFGFLGSALWSGAFDPILEISSRNHAAHIKLGIG
jgi:hypothetical protein